ITGWKPVPQLAAVIDRRYNATKRELHPAKSTISWQRIACRGFITLPMDTPVDPISSRYDHAARGLHRRALDPDPIKQFGNCFTAAIEAGIRDVNAMSLATATPDARPSVRIVLLKGFDHDGFVFFTNYLS